MKRQYLWICCIDLDFFFLILGMFYCYILKFLPYETYTIIKIKI